MKTPTRATALRALSVLAAAGLVATTAACGGPEGLTKGEIGSTLADSVKDQKTYTYQLTIGSGGQSRKGSGQVDLSDDEPKSVLKLTEAGQTATFLTVDGDYYAKIPTIGEKWVKPTGSQGDALKGVMGQFGIADPVKVITALDKATKVTEGKSKKVGGTDTTSYTLTLPSAAYADATGLPETAQAALPKTVSYQVFVDDDGLLRELDSSFTAQGAKVTLKTVLDDFGKKVSIAAPAASEIGALPGATPSPSASPKASPSSGG